MPFDVGIILGLIAYHCSQQYCKKKKYKYIQRNKYILTNLIKCSKYGHWPFVDPLNDQKFVLLQKNIRYILWVLK